MQIRPLVWSILAAVLIGLSGCASGPQSADSLRADGNAVEMYERTIRQCQKAGKTLVVWRTGGRRYSRKDLKRAQCAD